MGELVPFVFDKIDFGHAFFNVVEIVEEFNQHLRGFANVFSLLGKKVEKLHIVWNKSHTTTSFS